jgi:DNA replicative helicase MCM subunit Mcm2 (Cdc46/Mcm family)
LSFLFIALTVHLLLAMTTESSLAPRQAGANSPPSTRDYDDDDDASQPRVATPPRVGDTTNDDDEASIARAAAEVSVMPGGGGGGGTRQRPPGMEAANAAIQGTAGDGGEAQAFEVVDEGGELVRVRFHEFMQNYSEIVYDYPEYDAETMDEEEAANLPRTQRELYPYHDQAKLIAKRQLKSGQEANPTVSQQEEEDEEEMEMSAFSNTICVNYRHLLSYDTDLAEAIEGEYVRFEPYLRRATKEFLLAHHPELDRENGGGGAGPARSSVNSYFVAIYNAPTVFPVRALRTGTIGRFSSISGTVTRSSDVRPELLVGSFRCRKCGLVAPDVMQQYHLTRPSLCRNPRCQNRNTSEFVLELNSGGESNEGGGGSEFVDWQRLRVQENADEIPPGSMPRTIDVVVRNEMVERAKAGDRVVLTGSLVVVPDGSALARAGEAARAAGNDGRNGKEAAAGGGGGVRGLAALGVRELTYRTCFVACCVLPSDVAERVRRRGEEVAMDDDYINESKLFGLGGGTSGGRGGDNPKSSHEVAMEFTEEEKDEIRRMKGMPRLYDLVSDCWHFVP